MNELTQEDLEWIEMFYSDIERGMRDWKRPDDYLERAYRILYGTRQSVGKLREGLRRSTEHENE